jgi:hypothetical protein
MYITSMGYGDDNCFFFPDTFSFWRMKDFFLKKNKDENLLWYHYYTLMLGLNGAHENFKVGRFDGCS